MQQATNFGLDIQKIHGPRNFEDLSDNERCGHDLVTVNASNLIHKGNKAFLLAAMELKELAESLGLEVEDDYQWHIRKPLTNTELAKKLKEAQQNWQEGLEQYLWIAADISNAQKKEARYEAGGRKARVFMEISERLGFKVTPFWELKYEEIVLYEKFPEVKELDDPDILEEDEAGGMWLAKLPEDRRA